MRRLADAGHPRADELRTKADELEASQKAAIGKRAELVKHVRETWKPAKEFYDARLAEPRP
jgi:hypothetical protein